MPNHAGESMGIKMKGSVEVGERCKLGWKVPTMAPWKSHCLMIRRRIGRVEMLNVKSVWSLYGPGSVRILLGRNNGDGSEVLLG